MTEIKITPETYKKMNEEFEEDGLSFRVTVPTQKQIDAWKNQSSLYFEAPPARDLVQEMWDKIGGRPND